MLKTNSILFQDGMKKLESAWSLRDYVKFHLACEWCANKLTSSQISRIPNRLWKFRVQLVKERNENINKIEERDVYGILHSEEKDPMDLEIKSHFDLDDFFFTCSSLTLPVESSVTANENFFRCFELTQFMLCAKDYLNYKYIISSEELYESLKSSKHNGMNSIVLSVYETFYQNLIADVKYQDINYLYIRLSEYPVTVNSISNIIKSFLQGHDKRYFERIYRKIKNSSHFYENDEFLYIDEVTDEIGRAIHGEENEEFEKTRKKVLSYFTDGAILNKMDIEKQLDILEFLKTLIVDLESFCEYMTAPVKRPRRNIINEDRVLKNLIAEHENTINKLEQRNNINYRFKIRDHKRIVNFAKRNLLESTERFKIVENKTFDNTNNYENIRIRTQMIGLDRHFRRYYWAAHNSDAGIWIQDFGKSSYEMWIRNCIQNNLDPFSETDDLPMYYDDKNRTETWYHIKDANILQQLIDNLQLLGAREKYLKKFLTKNLNSILNSIESGKKIQFYNNRVGEADRCNLDGFKDTLIDFVERLDSSNFTRIQDVTDIIIMIKNVDRMVDLKKHFMEIVRSILKDRIVGYYLNYDEHNNNISYSTFRLDRFCTFVSMTDNISALFQMIERLKTKIKWDEPVSKICHICKRICRQRLHCQECSKMFHGRCVEVEISDPVYWLCPPCQLLYEDSDETIEEEPVLSENGVTYLRKAKKNAANSLSVILAPKRPKKPTALQRKRSKRLRRLQRRMK